MLWLFFEPDLLPPFLLNYTPATRSLHKWYDEIQEPLSIGLFLLKPQRVIRPSLEVKEVDISS